MSKPQHNALTISARAVEWSRSPEPIPIKPRHAAELLARQIKITYKLQDAIPCYNQTQADKYNGRLRHNCVGIAMIYPGNFLKPFFINYGKIPVCDKRNHYYMIVQAGQLMQQALGTELILTAPAAAEDLKNGKV
jgi:hypothetical protein